MKKKNSAAAQTGKKNTYLLAVSSLCILGALAAGMFFSGIDQYFVSMLMAIGMAMLAVAIVRRLRPETAIHDEMSKAINNRAMANSWWLTYVLAAILIFALHFNMIAISAENILSLMLFFMIFSFMAVEWYVKEKGVVQ